MKQFKKKHLIPNYTKKMKLVKIMINRPKYLWKNKISKTV